MRRARLRGDHPVLSAPGRFVAFSSDASNLVPLDANAVRDVFVHDRQTGITERVSVDSAGVGGNGASFAPSISGDGRFVAFHSAASNLVAGDTNGLDDIFVHDRTSGATERISVSATGAEGDAGSTTASVSAEGRFLAFASDATTLVLGDTNGVPDVFATTNCLAPALPSIQWTTAPPPAALGGDPIAVQWELADFGGPITENQAHFGINSVLGSSPVQGPTNGVHGHTFAAPNVGTFDSPQTYNYIVRALDGDAQVLSPVAQTQVSAGPTPPTVEWVIPPPASITSPGIFTVRWRVSNYVDPAVVNELVIGDTRVRAELCDQPGGNGEYVCEVNIPPGAPPGGITLNFAACAENPIEFAFTVIQPVTIGGP